jgi:hypothetical protein
LQLGKRQVWLSFHLFIALAAPAIGANHYIRAGATGSQTGGDWANACSGFTGSCAVSSLVRGDTYYVADGSYGSYSFNKAVNGTLVITIKKATANDHGTDVGWNSSYGDGVANFSGQINFATSYWVFDGITGGGPDNWTTGFGFKVTQSDARPALRTDKVSNITIRHIDVQGNRNTSGGGGTAQDGFAVYGGTNINISHYYIHDVGRCIFFLSTQDFIAEHGYTGTYTYTDAAHAELASVWGFAIPSNRVTFRNNMFTYIEGVGGLMFDNQENPSGGGMKVYGNIFYRPPGVTWKGAGNGLIGGWTGNGGEEFHDVVVYNNTFVNTNVPPFGTLPRIYSGATAYNNIFYNSTAPSFSVFKTHDYNWFYNSGSTAGEAHAQTGTAGVFTDLANANFHLSAATNTGLVLPAPFDKDPDGVTRGASGVWNRGAYQSGAVSGRPNAPTALVSSVQ